MKVFITILSLLGGILPLLGVGFGARRVIADYRDLGRKLDQVEQIMKDPAIPDTERSSRAKEVLAPEFTWGRLTYTYEWIRYLILRNAVGDLRGPAIATVVGIVCGTVASVWALFLT